MNRSLDQVVSTRHKIESDELNLKNLREQQALRKLQRSKMTMSQRILFNKKNPFQGSDGFTHLLFKTAHLNEH